MKNEQTAFNPFHRDSNLNRPVHVAMGSACESKCIKCNVDSKKCSYT